MNNRFFLLSSVFFYLLICVRPSARIVASITVSFLVVVYFASKINSVWDYFILKGDKKMIYILSFLSSIGILLSESNTKRLWLIRKIFGNDSVFAGACGYVVFGILIIFASYFLTVCLIFFWQNILKIYDARDLPNDFDKVELMIYLVFFVMMFLGTSVAFFKTEAFYGTNYLYDIIYTSDSPALVKSDVYLRLYHGENDLRQPLFAIFSAPFCGVAYLIAWVIDKFNFGSLLLMKACLINGMQILLLIVANFLLAQTMNLTKRNRIGFMLLLLSSHTYLLSAFMMEQYVVAYFWLIVSVCAICRNSEYSKYMIYAAGGSLITSLVLFVFMGKYHIFGDCKKWVKDMLNYGYGFIFLLFVFARFDVILTLKSRLFFLMSFTGHKVRFSEKFFQYTEFVRNCFFAPSNILQMENGNGVVCWSLADVQEFSIVGIVILALAIGLSWLVYKQRDSIIEIFWVLFSVFVLLIVGWGSRENGMVLYSLYFMWAVSALLFKEFIALLEKCNLENYSLPLCVCFSIYLLGTNIPTILEMIDFGIMYYPK